MPTITSLSPALIDALAESVRRGVPVETAAALAGVGRQTFYQWLQAGETGQWQRGQPVSDASANLLRDFSDKIRRAQAQFEADKVIAISEAAEEINEKTGQRDWRAIAWLLNNHPRYRKTYRIERQLEVNSEVTVRHEALQAKQVYDELGLDGLDALERMLPPPLEP